MKKFLIAVLVILTVVGLVACGNKNEIKPVDDNTDENVSTEVVDEAVIKDLTNSEMYNGLIGDYENALEEYDLENIDADENIQNKYPLVSMTLITHVARYSNEGINLTYAFYDIDKNGVDELLIGADGSVGAIYSYDYKNDTPVKIIFQSTMERGNMDVYDNGVILSGGAGGAALHYYEFGKIASNGISYELIESIEEEYVDGNEIPEYRDNLTREVLEYANLDEIMNKYLENANVAEKYTSVDQGSSNVDETIPNVEEQ